MTPKVIVLILLIAAASGHSVRSDESHATENRDLTADIRFAQGKLGVFIQECLRFTSTYQIITAADVKIEVASLFQQIYALMEQLQVSPLTIFEIKLLTEQDIEWLSSADSNMYNANTVFLGTAYEMNFLMRNNTLDTLLSLFLKFSNEDMTDFNEKYNIYLGTLIITGNAVEAAILAAIDTKEGPEVAEIHSLLQKCNDLISFDAVAMSDEMVLFLHDFYEANNAVYTVVVQLPPV